MSNNENFVKMTINVNKDTIDAVRAITQDKGETITTFVDKAMKMETFLRKEIESGSQIQVVSRDGTVSKIVFR